MKKANAQIVALIKVHATIIERTRTELVVNFDVPAAQIIGIACGKMGIQRADWDAIQRQIVGNE